MHLRFIIINIVYLFTYTTADTTSRYHPYRIDHACDVASSAFVPYTGIRIQQSRYTQGGEGGLQGLIPSIGRLRNEADSRVMRASVCIHGARYDQSYSSYPRTVPRTDWINWAAKFCFYGPNIPENYLGCFIMAKTYEEIPQTFHLLASDRQAGILYKCNDGYRCSAATAFGVLLNDEAYMAWDRPMGFGTNDTRLRIPLVYTAELISRHYINGDLPISELCTAQFNDSSYKYSDDPDPDVGIDIIIRTLITTSDKLLGIKTREKHFTMEKLNQRLITIFRMKNKKLARLIVEKLSKLVF